MQDTDHAVYDQNAGSKPARSLGGCTAYGKGSTLHPGGSADPNQHPLPPVPASLLTTAEEAARHGARSRWNPRALRAWLAGRAPRALARLLICAYFLNVVYAAVETWRAFDKHPQHLTSMRRWGSDPEPRPPAFPWLHVVLLLPAVCYPPAEI